jgi:hypothetical protein
VSQREEFEQLYIDEFVFEYNAAKGCYNDHQTQYAYQIFRDGFKCALEKHEINELKYINDRLQKHCSETTEQLNIALGKCASLEKANAAYRALEKKRNELSECLPDDPVSGGGL